MLAVILLAVMVDRPAISLRNLALAALLILVTQPESGIQASFQMSFMAVMGLAAFFEYWNKPNPTIETRIESRPRVMLRKFFKTLVASVLTTIVAGAFSSIPAAYHFGRLAPYGVLANGLALPVMSLIVMPAALISVMLMPFGLEALPLTALGKGLELILLISAKVANLPGAQRIVPQLPISSAILLAIGGSIICIARGHLRVVGAIIFAGGLLWAQFNVRPDIYIERTSANAAFRNANDELVFMKPLKARFAAEKWLQANCEEPSFKAASARPGWICVARICRATIKGKKLGFLLDGVGAEPYCEGLDIVIADYPLRKACKSVPVRIDRFDTWRNGAHAIFINGGAVVVTTARELLGKRPWVVVPEPRRRGATTHSTFRSAGSIPANDPDKAHDIRTPQPN